MDRMDPKDILRNPKDPLHKETEPREAQVLRDLGKVLHGVPMEAVANCGMNLAINAVRQSFATWTEAEKKMKDMQGRQMQILKDHYTSAGRVKGVFPYDQVIAVPPIKLQ